MTWVFTYRRGTPDADSAPVRSLAVLPLKPIAQGADDAEIGLGLAETIITRIGQIQGMTVRPTSAVRRYAAPDADALEAARDLQVDAVLDGLLHRAGDRLRVNMTLLRTSDGAPLWSQTFNTVFVSASRLARRRVDSGGERYEEMRRGPTRAADHRPHIATAPFAK